MDKMLIQGGRRLKGFVEVSGAKNSVLPLMFSTLLARGRHVFHNVPRLKDVDTACLLLKHLGCQVEFTGHHLMIDHQKLKTTLAPYDLVRKMRAGVLCLGPLLARYGRAQVSLPGGCAIGTRAVDWHVKGLSLMGADIKIQNGHLTGQSQTLKPARILMDFPSVGATENLMMAGCLSTGPVVIENAAREPEIIDLAEYLQKMGAVIKGAGADVITIHPVPCLKPGEHTIIPDRIEAGTLLLAAAITGGSITLRNCCPQHLDALILKLKEAGFLLNTSPREIRLTSPSQPPRGVDIATAPYPGFPTDLQAQFMALLTQVRGVSLVQETIFENRFMHIQELVRLGADIRLNGRTARVEGGRKLQGAEVTATDLRASAGLILAGLSAKGESVVHRVYHLDRGYECLEKKLLSLGGDIKRIT